MTAFKLQFLIPGIFCFSIGLFFIFSKKFDWVFVNFFEGVDQKNVIYYRYFWSALVLILGLLTLLTSFFDWPVMGYIIPRPS